MKDEIGDIHFPIWLLGDSEPKNWYKLLDSPFDARHPAVHNIWTPIISNIQKSFYAKGKLRIDEDKIYKRNPIKKKSDKPSCKDVAWAKIQRQIKFLKDLIDAHKPIFIFTFGSFSFEFVRRATEPIAEKKRWDFWRTDRLGCEFQSRISKINFSNINVLPLLHVSIARGKFLTSHERFTFGKNSNYFNYCGNLLAKVMQSNQDFINKVTIKL